MLAKFNTTCKSCWQPIAQGTEIQKNDAGVWVHEKCLGLVQEEPKQKIQTTVTGDVGLKINPDAKEGECNICTKLLSDIGDKWFFDKNRVCEQCYDTDIKIRNNADPRNVPFW